MKRTTIFQQMKVAIRKKVFFRRNQDFSTGPWYGKAHSRAILFRRGLGEIVRESPLIQRR
jgi:hypothetical protein